MIAVVILNVFLENSTMEQMIKIALQGGMKVGTTINGHTIETDQSEKDGGQNSAPTPMDLFLASVGTCSALYAQRFCESRKIPTQGLSLCLRCDISTEKFRVNRITFELSLPEGFPEKYRAALLRAMDLCTVKKHILTPPEFETVIVE